MNVADRVLKTLEDCGLKHIFCLPGGGCLFLIDAINRTNIKPIFNLHEQACGICAEAYSQYTQTFGCCLVTTGPGVINVMNAVAAAYYDSTPLIILSGQVNTNQRATSYGVRQYGIQEVPTERLVNPIVKRFIDLGKLYAPRVVISSIIKDAVFKATESRKGPVWIEIPLDTQQKEVIDA